MSVQDQFDPFRGDTGLKDDFDGYVADGHWATDPRNTRDPQALFGYLTIQADDGEEVEPRYSTGAGWSSFDGGHVAEHEKDNERRRGFNVNTGYFEVFSTAMNVGAEDEMRRRSTQELQGQGPRAIDGLWKGLKFHWEVKTETRKIRDRDTQEEREITTNRLLPTAFLGVVGAATATQGPATSTIVAPSGPLPQPAGVSQQQQSAAQNSGIAPPSPVAPPPAGPAPASAVDFGTLTQQPGPITQPPPITQPTEPTVVTEVSSTPASQTPESITTQTATAEAPTAGAPDWSWWPTLEPATQVKMVELSKAMDYNHFVDEVVNLPGTASVPQLIVALSDDVLYNALRAM